MAVVVHANPAKQSMQLAEPVLGVNVPGTHAAHVTPIPIAKVPATQFEQLLAEPEPGIEPFPGKQLVQVVARAPDQVPAPHCAEEVSEQ